jgi:predicted nucleic acid-binding protein
MRFKAQRSLHGYNIMTLVHRSYMLDTNVFNGVLDGKALPASLANERPLVTGIQAAELRATGKPERRAALLGVYEETRSTSLPASSFSFDIEGAGFDQACWNDWSGNFEKMLARLRRLDPRYKSAPNQVRDILIAETAIKHGATLVTGDSNLRQVVSEFGGGPQTRTIYD